MNSNLPEPNYSEEMIFAEALALPAGERAQFLDAFCKGDSELRKRLVGLLEASDSAKGFMEEPLSGLPEVPTITDGVGQNIGRYKLLQKIGEGGCGIVYMAEQQQPVRRRVALKVIKLGMDTHAVISRFEAERQALALMDHPNIARVLDAGATETGRPYFVMELVRGVKITDFCDQQKLGAKERFELFSQVCMAVQHAHQKGVIHRDLKPSNILVTQQDGAPVPKVIDFGIAKATLGRLTDHTLFTAFEQFIGTPAYMSPEQAEMTSQDVDTRSDIYSLGVLLYELLAGKTPFDAQTFRQVGIDEIRRLIREVEPPRPSLRFSTLTGAESSTVASMRGTDGAKLSILLKGDIDWIVMKALEKNRARRYETASAFAADINRFLANEPVLARPPSKGYLLQKFIRRNRGVFVASVAIFISLMAGFGGSTWMMVKERQARERAVAAEKAQAAARTRAEKEEVKAKVAAEKSKQAFKFIAGMLSGVGPSVAAGRDTKLLREILDQTNKRLEAILKDQPEVALALRQTLASIYLDLGDYAKAESMAREALSLAKKLSGDESEEVIGALDVLGLALLMQGQMAEGELLIQEALTLGRKNPGQKNEILAATLLASGSSFLMQGKLSGAELVLREALELAQRNEYETLASETVQLLVASVMQKQGRLADAEPMAEAALKGLQKRYSPQHPSIAYAQLSLANLLMMQGKLKEAETQFREALALLRQSLGAEHPMVAMACINLARIFQQGGRLREAEEQCREALNLQRKVLGPDHATTRQTEGILRALLVMQKKSPEAENVATESAVGRKPEQGEIAAANKKTELAVAAITQRKFAEAESALREVLPVFEKAFGRNRQDVVGIRMMLVRALLENEKPTEAAQVAGELLADCRSTFGNNSTFVANVLMLQATAFQCDAKLDAAEAALMEYITIAKSQTGDGKSPDVARGNLMLATIKAEQGKLDDRDRLVGEALEILRSVPENVRGAVVGLVQATAMHLRSKGSYDDAVAVQQVVVTTTRQLWGPDSDRLAQMLTAFAWMENGAKKFPEAEASAREAVAIRQRILPAGHWLISAAEYELGSCLFRQKKFEAAEALLLKAFENLEANGPENADPRYRFWRGRLNYTAGYLAQIYEDRGEAEKGAEWRATSAKYKNDIESQEPAK